MAVQVKVCGQERSFQAQSLRWRKMNIRAKITWRSLSLLAVHHSIFSPTLIARHLHIQRELIL